ncbi:MAG: hypothetical protein RLZ07_2078 [Pseudomonadota bacterium]
MRRSGERRTHPSALTRLVALLGLVDDVDAALAANQLVVAMTLAEALQAVADLHDRILSKFHAVARSLIHYHVNRVVADTRFPKNHHHMVGATGIEPVTPTMSR